MSKTEKPVVEKQAVEVDLKVVVVEIFDSSGDNVITLRYPVGKNQAPMVPACVSSMLLSDNPPVINISVDYVKGIEYI